MSPDLSKKTVDEFVQAGHSQAAVVRLCIEAELVIRERRAWEDHGANTYG